MQIRLLKIKETDSQARFSIAVPTYGDVSQQGLLRTIPNIVPLFILSAKFFTHFTTYNFEPSPSISRDNWLEQRTIHQKSGF